MTADHTLIKGEKEVEARETLGSRPANENKGPYTIYMLGTKEMQIPHET